MSIDADQLWQRLERDGEETVRKRLASGIYGPEIVELVKEWLSTKDRMRSMAYATTAKYAAWVSAIAAVVSAISAIVSILASGLEP